MEESTKVYESIVWKGDKNHDFFTHCVHSEDGQVVYSVRILETDAATGISKYLKRGDVTIDILKELFPGYETC